MKNKRPIKFRDLIGGTAGAYNAPLWVMASWLLGALIFEKLKEFFSENTLFGIPLIYWMMIILGLILVGMYLISRYIYRQRHRPVIEMQEKQPVGKAGVILLVSKINPRQDVDKQQFEENLNKIKNSNLEELSIDDFELLISSNLKPPLKAIEFHCKQGTLRDCWLISTQDDGQEKGSIDVPPILEKWCKVRNPDGNVQYHYGEDLCIHPRDYIKLWDLVDGLFESATYKPEHIIADITSGTKPMSVGVALACLPEKRTMQYMNSRRDWRGEPLQRGEIVPILIDIDPYLAVKQDVEG